MRLKIIFFPLVLIVSITIFANFIWPQINEVSRLNKEKLAKNAELQAIATKQSSINEISSKISSDANGQSIVKNYLPEKKVEEQVIASINYLANDSNVSLSNLSIKDAAIVVPAESVAIAAEDPTGALQASQEAVKIKPKSIVADISLVGDYAKIKIFLDSLEHMPISNTIQSLDIEKSKVTPQENGEAAPDNGILSANIKLDFWYMENTKIDTASVSNFKSNLDTETISVLGNYISQKSKFVAPEGEAKGSANPFLAN